MTVTDIEAELNEHGFEDTDVTEKIRAINFAIKNIAQRKPWPFLEKVMTLTFDGTNAAPTNTPADLRSVMKIMDLSTGRRVGFKRTDDMEEQYAMNLGDAGLPYFYYFEGSALKVWQVPSASQTLRLRYIRTAPEVVDGGAENTIIIPPAYHEAIVFRALFRLYDLEDDPEMSARFEAHYENAIQQMTDAMITQQLDEPEYIHVIDTDDFDY